MAFLMDCKAQLMQETQVLGHCISRYLQDAVDLLKMLSRHFEALLRLTNELAPLCIMVGT